MKTLIATDGSGHAAAGVLAATRILPPAARDVDLIRVIPHLHGHQALHAQRRAEKTVADAKLDLEKAGFAARAVVRVGSAARTLIGEGGNYDLIVVGAHSHKGEVLGLGPVVSRVLEHARTNVLIGRAPKNEVGLRILVPVDGSDSAERALDALPKLVDLRLADVTFLHVVESPWAYSEDEGGGEDEVAEEPPDEAGIAAELERRGDEILTEAETRLPPGVSFSCMRKRGLPAYEILGEIDRGDYDLVVVGASGEGDAHKLLGGVSFRVAWNAPCSVLIVRELP